MTASLPWRLSSRVMPTLRVCRRRGFRCRTTRRRTPAVVLRGDGSRKLKRVPAPFRTQPAAGRSNAAHSPVSGLPISSRPPATVGSSARPGGGAEIVSSVSSTRRARGRVRTPSRLPASGMSSASPSAAVPAMRTASAVADTMRRDDIRDDPTVHGARLPLE